MNDCFCPCHKIASLTDGYYPECACTCRMLNGIFEPMPYKIFDYDRWRKPLRAGTPKPTLKFIKVEYLTTKLTKKCEIDGHHCYFDDSFDSFTCITCMKVWSEK